MCCFFFQAEDGIRDRNVTGVQTCALPIFQRRLHPVQSGQLLRAGGRERVGEVDSPEDPVGSGGTVGGDRLHSEEAQARRSEERRVGKECRKWWKSSYY